jgi:large subunit ribosomal protein L15
MRLHDLKPAPGSTKDRKRLGRGTGTGQGTTAGKGTKGEKARSGGLKAGFRGMSSRNARMPKRRGFNNQFKIYYQVVNVGQFQRFEAGASVDPGTLYEVGLISDLDRPVKVLGDGELTKAVNLSDVKLSSSARAKIEAAGGSVTEVALQAETELVVVDEVTGEPVAEVIVDAVETDGQAEE